MGAARQIWRRYTPLVTGMLRRDLGASPDAHDLRQEIFLVVFQRLETLRRAEALRSFIAGICLRVTRNHRRHKRLRSLVGLSPDVDWAPAPVADHDTRDAVRRLQRLLDKLSPQDRALFVSRYVERMGIDEIASTHRMSFPTTRRRIARMTGRVSRRAKSDAVLAPYFQQFASNRRANGRRTTVRTG
jgi:RNA polymerase sigma-70 factor, ECF subfamily